MSDLIRKEEAVDILCRLHIDNIAVNGKRITEFIKEIPSVTDTNVGGKWIPIGQYPAEPSLLCFENGEMVVGHYDYDDCEWLVQCSSEYYSGLDISDDEPIAWMELPEAYKGE